MMAIEINLTAEDIDKLVKDSILKAGFGKAIEDGVKRAISPGYDNPIERATKEYVAQVCHSLLRDQFADKIRAVVSATIEAQVTTEVIQKVTDVAVRKMVNAAQDRY
jgi:citrate lyase gamma subunit